MSKIYVIFVDHTGLEKGHRIGKSSTRPFILKSTNHLSMVNIKLNVIYTTDPMRCESKRKVQIHFTVMRLHVCNG